MKGLCLAHYQVQKNEIAIDLRHLQGAGITVICRLNWGYADGTGTLPRPEDRDAFIAAVTKTILHGKGVDCWHVGNEPNNRQEWPGFGAQEYPLTPEYTIAIYNEIRERTVAPMGPPPLDPYFGPGSDNMIWWKHFLEHASGVDAFFMHLKTQDNDPSSVWSEMKFSDPPLQWQYMNLKAGETHAAVIPNRYRSRPIFVTECNPQRRSDGSLGWKPDNAEWVRQAKRYFESWRESAPIAGVAFYRYEKAGDQAPFGLSDKPEILEAIRS